MNAEKIELPRFATATGDRVDVAAIFGWVFELWGAQMDETWLANELTGRGSIPPTFPVLFPAGWRTKKNDRSLDRYASESCVDYWVVDDRGRHRVEVRKYGERKEAEYSLRILPRFSTSADRYYRETKDAPRRVLFQILEGGTSVAKNYIFRIPSFSEEEYPHAQDREGLINAACDRIINEAIAAHVPADTMPDWNDPVTSWFEPGANPFEGGVPGYLVTSGLLLRWTKLLGNSVREYLVKTTYPLRDASLFERVAAQHRRLMGV